MHCAYVMKNGVNELFGIFSTIFGCEQILEVKNLSREALNYYNIR